MALVKSIELDNGVSLPSSYSKICRLTHDLLNSSVRIEVSLFKDQASYEADKPEIGVFNYVVTYTAYDTYFNEPILASAGVTLHTQAEAYLLSLPFFSGATQV